MLVQFSQNLRLFLLAFSSHFSFEYTAPLYPFKPQQQSQLNFSRYLILFNKKKRILKLKAIFA